MCSVKLTMQLKLLSLVDLAIESNTNGGTLQYDRIIECCKIPESDLTETLMYAMDYGLISGKMDFKNQTLLVQGAFARDVQNIESVLSVLDEWSQNNSRVVARVESIITDINARESSLAQEKIDFDTQMEALKLQKTAYSTLGSARSAGDSLDDSFGSGNVRRRGLVVSLPLYFLSEKRI